MIVVLQLFVVVLQQIVVVFSILLEITQPTFAVSK